MVWVIHMITWQVVRAEQVHDLRMKVEGFGLNVEGQALSWFQTLNLSNYPGSKH